MKKLILFDGFGHDALKPLTFTKPVSLLRTGILTIIEKWQNWFEEVDVLTKEYLQINFPDHSNEEDLYVYGGLLPSKKLFEAIQQLKKGEGLSVQNTIIAHSGKEKPSKVKEIDARLIRKPADLFLEAASELQKDFEFITKGRRSNSLSATNTLIGDKKNLFIEDGAVIEASILNTKNGPIYIGRNAEIMEGVIVRGGLALCESATLKMGAKIYGATTIGPHSKVGGEVGNSIITGYSNKGHDGYLGNSVLGEWCNLGADTNTSNLKNNYGTIKVWSYEERNLISTGLQFHGLVMGDHSKAGINTMFNTGTIVGTNANVFGTSFPPKFIPSFAWGGFDTSKVYNVEKAIEVATAVCDRRKVVFSAADAKILRHIFQITEEFRK